MPAKVEVEKVFKVYSGLNHKCCCGCSGKYSFARKHRDFATKNRGYVVDEDEINEKEISRITALINKNWDDVEIVAADATSIQVAWVKGNRLYMLFYLRESI